MYSKYICEDELIFLDFDETGNLSFLVHNIKTHSLNSKFQKLSLLDELCIEKIFDGNLRLQNHIKKALSGVIKNKRLYEIESGLKARIIQN